MVINKKLSLKTDTQDTNAFNQKNSQLSRAHFEKLTYKVSYLAENQENHS